MPLSIAERKSLRAQAHALKPIILVGDGSVSDAVLAETDRALDHHELLKVRLPAVDRDSRAALARRMCESLGAEQVQAIGRIVVLFRARPAAAVAPVNKPAPRKPTRRKALPRKGAPQRRPQR